MQQTFFSLLTNKDARACDIRVSLDKESAAGAAWFDFRIEDTLGDVSS